MFHRRASEAAHEERGCERSAASAGSVGRRGGHDLREQHHGHVEYQQVGVAVEERPVEHMVPVALGLSVEQDDEAVPSLTIERREEEDERAEHQSAHDELAVGVSAHACELSLAPGHAAHEVEAHEASEHAEHHGGGYALHAPRRVEREGEHRLVAHEQVARYVGGDGCYEDGHDRRHRHVDHEHLEREHHAGDGRLVDACHGGGRSASHEQHELSLVELEDLSEVAAYGRSREHDGCLGSHRSAEADGDGRRHDRRPAVVAPQSRAVGGYGV